MCKRAVTYHLVRRLYLRVLVAIFPRAVSACNTRGRDVRLLPPPFRRPSRASLGLFLDSFLVLA